MLKSKSKYPIEKAIEKLADSARIYFFTRPKDKMDRLAHSMELISWLLLTAALIFRIGR